jgi:translation initiation factor 1
MTAPGRRVYSTDDPDVARSARPSRAVGGRARPGRTPPRPVAGAPGIRPDTVYVERTRKGRGGKTVTLVINLPGDAAARAELLKALKTACGAGGTLKDGVLEIQGDHRDKVIAHLAALGHTVKARGG